VDGIDEFFCECPLGYEGEICQTNIDDCAAAVCHNDGKCIDGIASHTCECAVGFSGVHCETNIDDCATNPCQNGGVCIDQVNAHICECPADFTGHNCETKVTIEVSTLVTVTEQTGEEIHRYFYSTCWGQKLWLRLLLKQNGFNSWMKGLFDKKDNAAWLKNLLEKNMINDENAVKLSEVLEEHAMSLDGDETARWWKNLSEAKWNGCVPFWSKLACKKELEDRIPTELDFIEDVIEMAPAPEAVAEPTTTAAPVPEPESSSEESGDASFLGCFIDRQAPGRDMEQGPGRRKFFNQGEEQLCFDACRKDGFKYAGLQWYGECWCSNSYGQYGPATATSNTQCDCRMGAKKFSFWGNCVYDLHNQDAHVDPVEAEVMPVESESSESESAAPQGQCRWETVIDIKLEHKHANLNKYTDRETFNRLASKAEYIRYRTNKIGTAVYKRKSDWKDVDQYDLFINKWSVRGQNLFHKDFDIYSTFEDAQADRSAWKYCNGDDNGVGFPRDCGVKKHTNWRWFAFPKDAVDSDEVDFRERFNLKYFHKRRVYNQASFEIYVCDESPDVTFLPVDLIAPSPIEFTKPSARPSARGMPSRASFYV
jgi:hypothetical protein